MNGKRGQSEVITTVLIILLVLAAVFIVWTAVRGMIVKSTNQATNKAACLDISVTLSDVKCAADTYAITADITRGNDDYGEIQIKPIVNQTVGTAIAGPAVMGTLNDVSLGTGLSGASLPVKIAVVIAKSVTCDPIEPREVTCPAE